MSYLTLKRRLKLDRVFISWINRSKSESGNEIFGFVLYASGFKGNPFLGIAYYILKTRIGRFHSSLVQTVE
jgi:hypothetical protein